MEADRIRLRLHFTVFISLLLLGIFGFMIIENLSLVDAIYFSIVTMATVGYGDIHPQYTLGKILAIVRMGAIHALFKKQLWIPIFFSYSP